MHDPVADMLSHLKNASAAGHERTTVPFSKFKHAIAHTLAEKGYIGHVEEKGKKAKKIIEVELAYDEKKQPLIHGHRRISRPSRRVYYGTNNIMSVKQGYGMLVMSTPKGVVSGEDARKAHVGGEALFAIW